MTSGNVLFIGNSGVGKSYLLNSIGGNFKSDFSSVDGLTAKVTCCEAEIKGSRVRLIDAPGLLEATAERMRNNAREITDALSMQDGFKLVFVLADSSGRVTPADLYTIERVMSAIDGSIPVGVIINKVPQEDLDLYDDSETKQMIISQLNCVTKNCFSPARFKAIPRYRKNEADGAADLVKELLAQMSFHIIPSVKSISATMEELSHFIAVLASKGQKGFLASIASKMSFCGNAESDQQNRGMCPKDATIKQPKLIKVPQDARQQTRNGELEPKKSEAADKTVSDEHAACSAQQIDTSPRTQPQDS
ncbi:hypothetical protein DFQ26_001338 [Actinomortierella ambigua]|nr:hypothetical protein DFQ26_001338 [Actinomortierella ambigua]